MDDTRKAIGYKLRRPRSPDRVEIKRLHFLIFAIILSSMETITKNQQKVLDYAKQHGLFRPRDLAGLGVHPEAIQKLCKKGEIHRIRRGLYELAAAEPDPNQTLVEACKLAPKGVICLLSALRFHGVGTQLPHKVYLAIPRTTSRHPLGGLPIEWTHLTPKMYRLGIEQHTTPSGIIRVYSLAKTLVDCFRFRNKVGIDVAVEALREVVNDRSRYSVSIAKISELAKQCRAGKIMRPYLEALTA
jgi:predicted transcriptional regulator of viral defense system